MSFEPIQVMILKLVSYILPKTDRSDYENKLAAENT